MSHRIAAGTASRGAALTTVALTTLLLGSAEVVAQHFPNQTPAGPPFFALQGARIVTGSGAEIENGTVVIGNGLIEAVGENVSIPGDARVFDVSGMTVYPGLFDALSEVGLAGGDDGGPGGGGGGGGGLAALLAAQQGVTPSDGPEDRPATNSWVSAADMLDPEAGDIERWRDAGFTTAFLIPGDGIVTGQGAVVNFGGSAREMVVKAPAALRITMSGAGFRSYPGSLMGVISYVRQLYLDAAHADQYAARYEANPRGRNRPVYDRALGPVQDAIRGGWPTLFPADEVREIRRAIRLGNDTGARVVLTGGHEAYGLADEIAASGAPVLVSLDWPRRNNNADPEAEETLASLERRAYAPTTPARLEEAGATWAFYSDDSGGPSAVMENVRKAMEHGLSQDAALRALTVSPARIYGVEAQLGTVEEGKIANLVVADGDIFAEETTVTMVFVDGKPFETGEARGERPEAPPEVDISGSWVLSLNNDSQEASAELEVDEDGHVSGIIVGERGEQQITGGWVSGTEFEISARATVGPGRVVEAVYSGVIEDGEMTGSVQMGQFTMDFTGTRPGGGR